MLTSWKAHLNRWSRHGLKLAGRYDFPVFREADIVQGEAAPFVGDIPPGAGRENIQQRLDFREPKPPQYVENLIYTSEGMVWVRGTLHEGMSQRMPSLKSILARPRAARCEKLRRGTIVQCETLFSYGDWVSEFVATLVKALPLNAPLLVPAPILDRSYARRDLATLGVETIRVERPVLVEEATVLYKARPMHYWTPEEITAYRKAFGASPTLPRPGSALYISREGERGESTYREYPSQKVAEVLAPLGVRIVLARETTQDQFRTLGEEAETVIADHGAAMFNMLLWNPRRVIELFNGAWWNNCFLIIAHGMGIRDYRLLNVDRVALPGISEDFERILAEPLAVG